MLLLVLVGCEGKPEEPEESDYAPRAYAQRMNREAITALYGNKPSEALALVDKAIADDSLYPVAYNTKASILANLGREREAIAALELAIALRSEYGEAYLASGILLEKVDRSEESRARYSRAIEVFEARRTAVGFDLENGVNLAIARYLRLGKVSGIQSINEVLAENAHYGKALRIKNRIKRDDRASFLRWIAEPASEEDAELKDAVGVELESESDVEGE